MTHSGGLMTLKIADSFIIEEYDNIIHYLHFTDLINNIKTIKSGLRRFPANESIYNLTLKQIIYLEEKIYSLTTHNRAKRGLINGLGTAIKWITGNMVLRQGKV